MKHVRRSATLLLVLAMVLSMAATAFAAGDGSITVSGTTAGKEYSIYKIFDLTKSGESAVAYTIDEDWEAFFAEGGAGAGYIVSENSGSLNPITVNGEAKYINITDSNVAEFSQAALGYAGAKAPDARQQAEGETLTFAGLDLGYYLVYPEGATDVTEGNACICSLTSTMPSAEVKIKAEYPVIEKTDDAVSAELGQVVNYTITGKVPDTTGFETYIYTVQDTMSSGLTFRKDVAVTFDGTAVTGEVNYEDETCDFILTFDMTQFQAYVGKEIVITYSAVVNENAISKTEAEKNSAVLIYSNDPKDSESTTENPPEEEYVYTAKLVIDKVDGADNTIKLEGAEFVLKNGEDKFYNLADNVVSWVDAQEDATVVTTDAAGAASFAGLKVGTYYLVETKAPDGYNLLTEPVEVEISGSEDETVSVSVTSVVANRTGTTLPSTGGMGTKLLYTAGGIMVLAAAVLLLTRKRMGVM